MEKLIQWYLTYNEYTEKEKLLLDTRREDLPEEKNDQDYFKLSDEFFVKMPFCNISSENRYLTVDDSGTTFIKNIFKDEVDDETLVISTLYEHGSVQECLKNCKNTYILNLAKDILTYNIQPIIEEAKKFKKVFIYIIGTQLSTGEITPQSFFIRLKEALETVYIPHKMLIDDVHGMFVMPRDYSIFDYVLYTAHSLVPEYDMGMLVSKDGKYGKKAYNWLEEYLKRLNIILCRREKMVWFKNIMLQYFSEILADSDIFRVFTRTTDHIFAVETKDLYYTEDEWKILDDHMIRVSEHNVYGNFIRIRFQEFTRLTVEEAFEGLRYFKKLLKKKIVLKKMKGE